MSYFGSRDFGLEVARGNITGIAIINKFGEATDCDTGVDTDIWDGADGSTSTDIWVAPTEARTHDISSTSTDDDGSPVGTGARTIRVWGLTDWDTAEVSEDLTMDGTTNVPTSNTYVIIHRMKILTAGGGGTNAGIITATAQTDGTVTAAIQAGDGQTLMAIYGVPSTQKIYLATLNASILKNATTAADLTLLVKENADSSDSLFVVKDRWAVTDQYPVDKTYTLPKRYDGPCIVKLQINTNTVNSKCTGSFDAYLVDN